MHARQAAAFKAVQATGLSKSDIARIAGIHRSQASRWFSGDQRPSYERTMRLATHLRRTGNEDLADELVNATGYGPEGIQPELRMPPDVLKVLLKHYDADELGSVIDMLARLEAISERDAQEQDEQHASPGEGRSQGSGGGPSRAG